MKRTLNNIIIPPEYITKKLELIGICIFITKIILIRKAYSNVIKINYS